MFSALVKKFIPSFEKLEEDDSNYYQEICEANLSDLVVISPTQRLSTLEAKYENNVYLKREDHQPVFSFKLRGAYNRLKKLKEGSQVITASAGNHAQGLAYSASHLGIKARIVMPATTPQIKVDAVKNFGGEVIIHGHNFDAANDYALELSKKEGLSFVPPFDDHDVIVGQGTVARELYEDVKDVDVVFIPVGGGGLLAGMATYLKHVNKNIRIVGVEAKGSACLQAAMEAGKPVDLDYVSSFADGVAVKRIGVETFRLAQKYCDEVVVATSDEICAAMQDIFVSKRAISEPSGALSLAGLKKWCEQTGTKGKNLAAILSGANLNFSTLRYVAERTAIGQKNEALLAVTIPEEKGSFKAFCKAIHSRPITEFNYRYSGDDDKAEIFVGIGLRNGLAELEQLKSELDTGGYQYVDLTDNELAKLHVRYMVGGRGGDASTERLFRFEFPEYPGALLRFLETLGSKWNISLFHYRNQGGAIGFVLAGVEVAKEDEQDFAEHLKDLGYQYREETENSCYQRFLR